MVLGEYMVVSVHQLDDGAWLSVNDTRQVNVSQLWLLARHDFCGCEVADFLTEGFVEIGVEWPEIEGRIAGQCIACGASGVTDWLALGRVNRETGEFRAIDSSSIRIPERRTRLATPE